MIEVTMAAARGETDTLEYTDGGATRPVTTGSKPIVINRTV
jgi:hypothetical protein